MAANSPPTGSVPTNLDNGPHYPGGADDPLYRWVFGLFVVLFLGLVSVGLLNFLGMFLKKTT